MTPSQAIRLHLLGVPSIEGPGKDPAGVLSQPKRLALLAYVAVQGGFVRRDLLVEMFWADSNPEKARRALNQAAHVLRRSLGKDVIRSRGNEELGISPDHVWIDVRAFEAAIAGDRREEAVDLYHGELLGGFNADQFSQDFTHWLETERIRLQRAASGAARHLADVAFHAGDLVSAVAWQRRAVNARPLDETLFRDYLALVDEAGDAAMALREFESFRTRLASEYDLEPARETVRLIEMIRSRRPEVTPAGRPASATPADTAAETPAGHSGAEAPSPAAAPPAPSAGESATPGPQFVRTSVRRLPRYLLVGLVMVPLLLVGWLVWDLTVSEPPPGDARSLAVPNRIAVLYFETTGPNAEDIEYIATGLTSRLIEHLLTYPSLDVVPLHVVRAYRGKTVTRDSLRADLRAALYVSGQVTQNNDGALTVTAELLDSNWKLIWSRTLDFDRSDMVSIEKGMIAAITSELPRIGAEIERHELMRDAASDIADEHVFQAITLREKAQGEVGVHRFDLAASLLSSADSLLVLASTDDRQWAKPWIERARVSASRGFFCMYTGTCEPSGAFRKGVDYANEGIAREPDNADAQETKATLLWTMWIYGTSDTTLLIDAEGAASAAIAIRPRSPRAYNLLSKLYAERGRYEQALTAADDALRLDEFMVQEEEILQSGFEAAFNIHRDSIADVYCTRLELLPTVSFRALSCRLQLVAWSDNEVPDIQAAWAAADRFEQSNDAETARAWRPLTELLVATVIAAAADRDASLADSARHLVDRAMGQHSPANDEPLLYGAAAYARLNDGRSAVELLADYLTNGVRARLRTRDRRWFEGLNIADIGPRTLSPRESH